MSPVTSTARSSRQMPAGPPRDGGVSPRPTFPNAVCDHALAPLRRDRLLTCGFARERIERQRPVSAPIRAESLASSTELGVSVIVCPPQHVPLVTCTPHLDGRQRRKTSLSGHTTPRGGVVV